MDTEYKRGWNDAVELMQNLLEKKYGKLSNKDYDELAFPQICAKDFARDMQGKIAIIKTSYNKSLNPTFENNIKKR